MSSAIIESPVTSSQLFFDWSDQSEVGITPHRRATGFSVQAKSSNKPDVVPQDKSAAPNPTTLPPANQRPLANTLVTISQSEPAVRASSCLSFSRNARIEKPVRMGAVMIKLLKRYGITDQEIAEGVANYARKHQQALAS